MNPVRTAAGIVSALDAVSPRVAARVADQIWFTPRLLAPSTNGHLPEGTRSISVTTPTARLQGYVTDEGGPTVLLVHGWAGSSSQLGGFVGPLRAAGFRVAGIDLPAHGRSPGWRTNVYEMAESIRAVARRLGEVDAVVTHSMGALATAFALRDGLELSGVVLVAPAVRLEHGLDRFRTRLDLSSRTEDRLRSLIASRFGSDVWSDLRLDRLAAEMQTPALIFHDRDDREIPYSHAVAVADVWPDAELTMVSGPGHYRILSDDDVIEQAVAWVSSRARSGSPSASARSSRPD